MTVPTFIQKFQVLINNAKEASLRTAASSPFINRTSKSFPEAVSAGLDKVKAGLKFDVLEADDFDIFNVPDLAEVAEGEPSKTNTDLTLASDDSSNNHNPLVVMNWLLDVTSALIQKVTQHAAMLKFTMKVVDKKAEKEEIEKLKEKIDGLEKECNEVKQRGMKGNIILSSPESGPIPSLLLPREILDTVTNSRRRERPQEMCARAILEKTGITLPLEDIAACHSLGSKTSNTTYIVRITNRKPSSAWDCLAAGMLTGRNKVTSDNFTGANLFLNFQLTKRNGELAKVVRLARKDGRIKKYGVDQNGRITAKVSDATSWEEVTSEAQLRQMVQDAPPAPPRLRTRPSQARR